MIFPKNVDIPRNCMFTNISNYIYENSSILLFLYMFLYKATISV